MMFSKFLAWCKERWELLVGILVGALAIIASLKSGGSREILEEKRKSDDRISDSKDRAIKELDTSLNDNLEAFFSEDASIKDDMTEKLNSLETAKKERVDALIKSSAPEDEIAEALKELLK